MASPARRLLASTNFLVTLVLLGVLFIFINFISSRRYARKDISRQQTTTLSDQTLRALSGLTEPVSVTVFFQPTSRLYDLTHDLLTEYERRNPNLKVEYVDPQQDIARAEQLVKELQITDLNLVVFRAGNRSKHLTDADLAELDFGPMQMGGQPRVTAFKGEDAFTSAIIAVTRGTPPAVWFTSGHGEKSIEDTEPLGLTELKEALTRQDMKVETVTLLERTEIPAEIKLVVIAGPTRRFTDQETALLQAYLMRGGKLLALLDPLDDSGLTGWLANWGAVVGNDIVVDPARQLPFVSAANLFVTEYSAHPLVEKMKTLATLFPLARSVRRSEPQPEGVTVTPLATTSPDGWGETQTSVEQFEFHEGQDLKGPVPVAAAVERTIAAQGEAPAASARMVVIGDSDFVINAQLPNVGNRDFILAAVYWLIEQEDLIGIGPKPMNSVKLNLTAPQLTGVFWFSFLALPVVFGALGAMMWWTRRT
jgi:ABC-type uncharacterized transport system involved in gliding motility auxiliary subunit